MKKKIERKRTPAVAVQRVVRTPAPKIWSIPTALKFGELPSISIKLDMARNLITAAVKEMWQEFEKRPSDKGLDGCCIGRINLCTEIIADVIDNRSPNV